MIFMNRYINCFIHTNKNGSVIKFNTIGVLNSEYSDIMYYTNKQLFIFYLQIMNFVNT